MGTCGCRPPYFPEWKNFSDCTFSEHASCISPNLGSHSTVKIEWYNLDNTLATTPRYLCSKEPNCKFTVFNFTNCNENCPVECERNSYVRNVEYGKYHEPIYRTLEKFSTTTGNQDIDIAAFQVMQFINYCITRIVLVILSDPGDYRPQANNGLLN